MYHNEIKRLLTEIFAEESPAVRPAEEMPPCHANQEEIVAYIEAEQAGLDVAANYPALHSQLQSCVTCYTLYEELKELLEMERSGTLLEPPVPAEFIEPPRHEAPQKYGSSEKDSWRRHKPNR